MAATAIISIDGHVKGSRRQYRDYVPKQYLDVYDEQVKAAEDAGMRDAGNLHPEFDPDVQWDSEVRIRNLESIGVVAEVLFANGQPFQVNRLDDFASSNSLELGEVGRQVYNRWLVDFCAEAPERRRGQLAISLDDVDRAVEEVHWAKEQGLGGVRLPGLTREGRYFFDPDLDPVWAACQEVGLVITQHGGAADPNEPAGSGPGRVTAPGFGAFQMISTENVFFSNRSLWMLVASGVFDRFPELRAAWIETQVHFITPTIEYLDRVCESDWMGPWSVKPSIKRLPSEYFGTSIFIGLSPFSPRQDPSGDVFGADAEGTVKPGFHPGVRSLMYGVDYPHFETNFKRNMGEVATLVTTPVLTEADAHHILFDTAADLFDFDVDALQPHIDRVGFEISAVRAEADELKQTMTEYVDPMSSGGLRGLFAWAAPARPRRPPPDRRRVTSRRFSSLAVRNDQPFFAGQLVSVAGTWMQTVAASVPGARLEPQRHGPGRPSATVPHHRTIRTARDDPATRMTVRFGPMVRAHEGWGTDPLAVTTSTTSVDLSAVSAIRFVVTRLARELRQEALADGGLTPTKLATLASVNRLGPIALSELAAAERLSPPSVTRSVNALVDAGLVTKANDRSDRRIVLVTMTDAGRKLLERTRRRKDALLAQRIALLDPDDLEQLLAALPAIQRLLDDPR